MLLTLIEIILLALLVLGIAVVVIFALSVVMTYVTQASYVDPLNEGFDDD